jgi:hypothetical protein
MKNKRVSIQIITIRHESIPETLGFDGIRIDMILVLVAFVWYWCR